MNQKAIGIRNNFSFFGGISVIYGIVFAFCMYRNLFGFSFVLYTAATVGVLNMFMKKTGIVLKKEVRVLFVGVILCGVSTCITANRWIQILNWCCVIFILAAAVLMQVFENMEVPFFIKNLTRIILTTIRNSFLCIVDAKNYVKQKKNIKRNEKIILVISGIITAMIFMSIIFPLLLSSDQIFFRFFENFIYFFLIRNIREWISEIFGILITAFSGFAIIYAFFIASCTLEYEQKVENQGKSEKWRSTGGIAFTAVFAGIYAFYCFIQIFYLFLGGMGTLPDGITYSQYAREGFFQLVLVAGINVVLVISCKYLFQKNKILQMLLLTICICTLIMTGSAAYRMFLYVQVYHLTFLRVFVFWFLTILALILAGVIVSIYKERFGLVKYLFTVAVAGYLLFSFSQPDYWIARYNVGHTDKMTSEEVSYLLYGLSEDAVPVLENLDMNQIEQDVVGEKEQIEANLYQYFLSISQNSDYTDFRKTSISRLRAYNAAARYVKKHKDQVNYYNY